MKNKDILLFTVTLIYYEINDILKKLVYNNLEFFIPFYISNADFKW